MYEDQGPEQKNSESKESSTEIINSMNRNIVHEDIDSLVEADWSIKMETINKLSPQVVKNQSISLIAALAIFFEGKSVAV